MRALLAVLLTSALPAIAAAEAAPAEPAECTYRTYAWDVKAKRGVGHRQVKKPRHELTADEKDPADPRCTVCSEDQVTVKVEGLPAVEVCRHYADDVRQALENLKKSGKFQVERLIGYRPGKTRGEVVDGLRTQFSNHSFGTAIDINAHHNGMYNNCRLQKVAEKAADIAKCRLGMGGAWDPERRPRTTVTRGGVAWLAFTKFWKWGGELEGQLKDFMHFSVTGE